MILHLSCFLSLAVKPAFIEIKRYHCAARNVPETGPFVVLYQDHWCIDDVGMARCHFKFFGKNNCLSFAGLILPLVSVMPSC